MGAIQHEVIGGQVNAFCLPWKWNRSLANEGANIKLDYFKENLLKEDTLYSPFFKDSNSQNVLLCVANDRKIVYGRE